MAQVLHLCLGACSALLYGGEGRELTRSCILRGSSSALPQWCLSFISATVLLKQFRSLSSPS